MCTTHETMFLKRMFVSNWNVLKRISLSLSQFTLIWIWRDYLWHHRRRWNLWNWQQTCLNVNENLSPILFAYHKALLLYVCRNLNTHRNLLEQHTEEIKILDEKSSSLRRVFVIFVVLFWTTAMLTCFSASKDRCKVDKKRYENLTVTRFN